MGNGFGMGFGGGFMWLIWLLFVVVLIWLLKDVFSRQDRPGKKDKSALEILQERYARGEIDHDEFEQKRKDLTR
jgi:putative membrane protein